jgi:hypothetical protein
MNWIDFIRISIVTGLLLLEIVFVNYLIKKYWGTFNRKNIIRRFDRTISHSETSQIRVLGTIILFIFVFIVTLSLYFPNVDEETVWKRIWYAVGHFFSQGLYNRQEDGIHNLCIFFINLVSMILLGGILISVISNVFQRRIDKIKNGQVHYDFSKHIVIFGYGKMTLGLIKQLIAKCDNEIVIQTTCKIPDIYHELLCNISHELEKKVILISGNRNSVEDIEVLRLEKAEEIYILGETDEYEHDAINIECVKKIHNILKSKNVATEKNCYVLFENQTTYAILQQYDFDELRTGIPAKVENGNKDFKTNAYLNFMPFNFHEIWAHKIFIDGQYSGLDEMAGTVKYLPLDREPILFDSDKTVHLLIAGMSKMGIAFAILASHICHYPNFIRNKKLKTRITFIDENADKEMYYLQGKYRHLFNNMDYSFTDILNPSNDFDSKQQQTTKFTDIEWHFIKGRIENPKVQSYIERFADEENSLLTIAVCLNLPSSAIATSLYFPDNIYLKQIPVLVKQNSSYSILSMLKDRGKYANIKPFGMRDNCLDFSQTVDLLPKKINYVYNFYFNAATYRQIPTTIPIDECNIQWKSLPVSKQWSNRYHADMMNIKIRSFEMDKHLENLEKDIDLIAEVEHNRWNMEELLLGYRPTNDVEKKYIANGKINPNELKTSFIHHDISPFESLPESKKDIDRMISYAITVLIKESE